MPAGPLQCPCEGRFLLRAHVYGAPPAGETAFPIGEQTYRRELLGCEVCRHVVSRVDIDLADLYSGSYVDATYGGDGMRSAFDRIVALPPEKSNNVQRVARIVAYADATLVRGDVQPTILDVGSGLCVFLHRMQATGWRCTALDPDQRAAEHARTVAGVEAVCADFRSAPELGRFDVITLNKVLEHVEDPVGMLEQCAPHLEPGGFVYVEVPDAEAAAADGYDREEFFIEHLHVFSAASLALMAERAGFRPDRIERIREPSTKYTLYAFLAPTNGRG